MNKLLLFPYYLLGSHGFLLFMFFLNIIKDIDDPLKFSKNNFTENITQSKKIKRKIINGSNKSLSMFNFLTLSKHLE